MRAAVDLLHNFKDVEIIEAGFLIELAGLEGRKHLSDVNVFSVIRYD
jgi:adenine/guanine phosphoribosyltransferase-like PRPP-binding protein